MWVGLHGLFASREEAQARGVEGGIWMGPGQRGVQASHCSVPSTRLSSAGPRAPGRITQSGPLVQPSALTSSPTSLEGRAACREHESRLDREQQEGFPEQEHTGGSQGTRTRCCGGQSQHGWPTCLPGSWDCSGFCPWTSTRTQ